MLGSTLMTRMSPPGAPRQRRGPALVVRKGSFGSDVLSSRNTKSQVQAEERTMSMQMTVLMVIVVLTAIVMFGAMYVVGRVVGARAVKDDHPQR